VTESDQGLPVSCGSDAIEVPRSCRSVAATHLFQGLPFCGSDAKCSGPGCRFVAATPNFQVLRKSLGRVFEAAAKMKLGGSLTGIYKCLVLLQFVVLEVGRAPAGLAYSVGDQVPSRWKISRIGCWQRMQRPS
jgi:hypothetical protein